MSAGENLGFEICGTDVRVDENVSLNLNFATLGKMHPNTLP